MVLRGKVFVGLIVTFVAISAFILFVYEFILYNRVHPGLYIAGDNYSFLTKESALNRLINDIDFFEKSSITLQNIDSTIDLKPSDLGIYIDKAKTFDQLYASGRKGSLSDWLMSSLSFFGKTEIEVHYQIDPDVLYQSLTSITAATESSPLDSSLLPVGGEFQITPERVGFVVDKSKLIHDLKVNIKNLSKHKIVLSYLDTAPDVYAQENLDILDEANTIAKNKFVFKHGYDTWTLPADKLLSIIKYSKNNLSTDTVLLLDQPTTISFHEKNNPKLHLSLDENETYDFIKSISSAVNRQKVDASLRFENGKVSEFNSAIDGQELDEEKTLKTFRDALHSSTYGEARTVNVNLPVNVTRAEIANDQINSLGIKELIGSGVSYFAGSIPNRVHNLTLGSSMVSGTLVKPGEVFSFTSLVGPVSASQGFKSAYVIKSGRTVLDDGGGICQVSTTVFRAALNTGLPIIKRTAHAYRVSYYEQKGFKPGLDATIWSPSVDLQFKNDTEHHILVQATVDRAQSKLQVDIYGTSDGRKIELGEPQILSQSPAPPPMYQDDPTLPKGVTKQVDFAAGGATTVFTRKVFKGDQLLIDESFKSVFKPWQAVFLVGTG